MDRIKPIRGTHASLSNGSTPRSTRRASTQAASPVLSTMDTDTMSSPISACLGKLPVSVPCLGKLPSGSQLSLAEPLSPLLDESGAPATKRSGAAAPTPHSHEGETDVPMDQFDRLLAKNFAQQQGKGVTPPNALSPLPEDSSPTDVQLAVMTGLSDETRRQELLQHLAKIFPNRSTIPQGATEEGESIRQAQPNHNSTTGSDMASDGGQTKIFTQRIVHAVDGTSPSKLYRPKPTSALHYNAVLLESPSGSSVNTLPSSTRTTKIRSSTSSWPSTHRKIYRSAASSFSETNTETSSLASLGTSHSFHGRHGPRVSALSLTDKYMVRDL